MARLLTGQRVLDTFAIMPAAWQPSDQDYEDVLRGQNPWQNLGSVPSTLAPPTRRPLAEQLWRLLLHPPLRRHQIILGPRRVGKTTVMYQTVQQLLREGVTAQRLWWLRLDHPLLLDINLWALIRYIVRVSGATEAKPVYVFLDEVTYAERWDLYLKTFYDENWPVRLVGTSSATAAISARGTESGVGRWNEHYLAPYLFTEFLALHNAKPELHCSDTLSETLRQAVQQLPNGGLEDHRRRFVLTGGFPELLLKAGQSCEEEEIILNSQRVLRQDAIEKAIYKDIPQAFDIQEPQRLERLLYTLAGQITGVLSPTTIQSDIGLNSKTVEKYVNYLERTFLVFTLPNYSPSEETVQRRGRKLYFVDSAVRNAALLRGIRPLRDAAEMGLLIENTAAAHMNSLALQSSIRLYHWRKKGAEADLIYDHPEDPLAFEISGSPDHHRKGLIAFQEAHHRFRGRCYLVAPGVSPCAPTDDEPGAIPLDTFLAAVGLQAEHVLALNMTVRSRAAFQQRSLFPELNDR